MKRIIHVNQHIIKRNSKTGEQAPPLTCKTYKDNSKCTEVIINSHTRVIYRPNKPLPYLVGRFLFEKKILTPKHSPPHSLFLVSI